MPVPTVRRALTIALLCVTACSSDDDAGSPSTADVSPTTSTAATAPAVSSATAVGAIDRQRHAIVAKILADSGGHGYTLDEACLNALVGGLDESDVSILATSATDPSGNAPT